MGEVIAYIRGKLDLNAFGIGDNIRLKTAITGAYVLEILGEDNEARADRLCAAMSPLAEKKGARVARPVRIVELRVRGLDDSISPEELREAVASTGGCRPTEIKVGRARASPGGLHSAWVQCPQAAARKMVAGGTLRVGWVRAPIDVLERRTLQCHRCLRRGHVMATCPYIAPKEDRRGRCFRCGGRDHRAAGCDQALKCPLCADLSRPSAHRLGGKA